MKLPALLINADMKRKMAKDKVRQAIENIKAYGIMAGLSDRTIYEFDVLINFMKTEIKDNESGNKNEMGRSSEKRELSPNHALPI